MSQPSQKCEIIEQALQEAVGGGQAFCSFSCSFLSKDICSFDICGPK